MTPHNLAQKSPSDKIVSYYYFPLLHVMPNAAHMQPRDHTHQITTRIPKEETHALQLFTPLRPVLVTASHGIKIFTPYQLQLSPIDLNSTVIPASRPPPQFYRNAP